MRCLVLLSLFVCSYSTLALDEVLSIDSNRLKIRALTITDIEDPNEVGIKKTPSRLLFPELKVIKSPSLEGRLFYIDANSTRCKGTNFVPQIWRQSGNKYEKIADFQLQQCDTVQPDTVQSATVCCRRFNVSSDIKEGDVLGILHGNGTESSLSYKLNAGLRVLYEEEISNDSDVFFISRRNDSRGTDYPLLAIETGVISNLLSCGTLETLMITVMPSDQKEHKIKLTCNATIESWSFVGTLQRGMNRSGLTLILQQRSCSGNHNCMMINKTEVDIDDFKDTIHPNVFKVSTVRWTVNAGDDITVSADNGVFALYSVARESRHLLHNVDLSSGPTGGPPPTDMPLLAIKTSPSNNCSWIMYDMETLANRALLVEEVIMTPIYIDGYLCIFPGISFTEEGSITKWTFAAKINSDYSGTQYPSLHLWRKSDDKYIHISGSNTNISEEPSIEFGALNVFSYKLNISYQQGDIIGVYQPPTNESALTLVCFNSSSFHTNITTTRLYNLPLADYTWNLSFIRPLMNLSVSSRKNGHLETENPSSEMSTSSEVSTTTSSFELNTGSVQQSGLNAIILLVSGGVGGIVLILVLVIIILIMIIVIIRSRRKKESFNPSATQRDLPEDIPEEVIYDVIQPCSKHPEQHKEGVNVYHTAGGETHAYDIPIVAPTNPQPYETPSVNVKSIPSSSKDESNMYATPSVNVKNTPSKRGEEINLYTLPNTNVSGSVQPLSVRTPGITTHETVNNSDIIDSKDNSKENFYHVLEKPVSQKNGGDLKKNNGAISDDKNTIGFSNNLFLSLEENQPATSTTSFEESKEYWVPASDFDKLCEQLAKNKYCEVPRDQIQQISCLGSGRLGTVSKGLWRKHSDQQEIEVAIKTLKNDAQEKERLRFLQEGAINVQFHHPNIVELLGMVTVGKPFMIILEFLPNGDLWNFLNDNRQKFSTKYPSSEWSRVLLEFCQQIAAGMEYLSNKGFVHRDLTAKNILLTQNRSCKITGFGMLPDSEEDHTGLIPVRWTALEALNYGRYSSASDVWSFGVVMYEIWSLGRRPFAKFKNSKIIKLIEEGHRQKSPPGCPWQVYSVMMKCWHPDFSSRPSFSDLCQDLNKLGAELSPESPLEPEEGRKRSFSTLGCTLERGKDLHTELQRIYLSDNQQILT